MKHVGIEIKFYNLDTFKKPIDVNFIDLDSNSVDLNYKVTSLIFCHFWRSIESGNMNGNTNRNRKGNRHRNRNGKRNLYKNRDNIYPNLS